MSVRVWNNTRRRRAWHLLGRARHLSGLGHPLMPPWQIAESGPDGVTMQGHFTRFHIGGNGAVHGGVIPLVSRAWIDSIDGRNAFGRATMRDSDGNVLSEASGLTFKLLPHQP
ncbi:MAG TPA: hypothetical protein VJ777_19220 [Mycobacterium sp.]|nr:hypothetical protein [Mycobacterium sp.]